MKRMPGLVKAVVVGVCGAWLTPTEIMTARVARVNAEFSW